MPINGLRRSHVIWKKSNICLYIHEYFVYTPCNQVYTRKNEAVATESYERKIRQPRENSFLSIICLPLSKFFCGNFFSGNFHNYFDKRPKRFCVTFLKIYDCSKNAKNHVIFLNKYPLSVWRFEIGRSCPKTLPVAP